MPTDLALRDDGYTSPIIYNSSATNNITVAETNEVVIYADNINGEVRVQGNHIYFDYVQESPTSGIVTARSLPTGTGSTFSSTSSIVYNTHATSTWTTTSDTRVIIVRGDNRWESSSPHIWVPKKPNLALERRKEKKARRAATKGIKLFRNLFGSENISAFLSGNSFTIEGKRYNYVVKSKNNVIRHTMNPSSHIIPYHLEVVTKEGLVLGSGCTVFKNTPVIDQLIAMMLHIQENEEHVLRNMNITGKTDEFYNDSWLSRLKKN